jgi:hypothetical protein
MRITRQLAVAACIAMLSNAMGVRAEEATWDFGARVGALFSEAPPANDMMGYGVVLRRSRPGKLSFGLAVDFYEFDYEEPYKSLGIARGGPEPIDGVNDSTTISAWVERAYGHGNWRWFWTLGAGYADISADAVSGPTATGGTFDIVTDAKSEFHVLASLGIRRQFAAHWYGEVAVHAQHHGTDYSLRDRVTGRTGSIGSQAPFGISGGLFWKF